MDLISAYQSSERDSSSDQSDTAVFRHVLKSRAVRRVYLITYSQADLEIVPQRQTFADIVLKAFSECSKASIICWVCSKEKHKKSGVHYHLALKLDKIQRWLPIKNHLKLHHNITVHFSSEHANYYTAWKYVVKEDGCYVESVDHPALADAPPPRTLAASQAHIERTRMANASLSVEETGEGSHQLENDQNEIPVVCTDENEESSRKRARLTSFDVAEAIIYHNIKSRTELLAYAKKQKEYGKTNIAEFVLNKGQKKVDEILSTAWEMERSQEKLDRARLTRINILEDATSGECVAGCDGKWLEIANNILESNGIEKKAFTDAMKDAIENGRGKYRNVMLVGPANCGKTFLLNPLSVVFNCFQNPANTNFAWVGAEEAEIIFLNDFRWNQQILPWSDMLLLLEGALVHLPAPKTHFAKDISFSKDTPIFCTSKQPIVFIRGGSIDDKETEMMTVRWKIFRLNRQVPENEQIQLEPCGHCFSKFVLCV